MKLADWVTLGVLGAVVGAVVLARRRGKAAAAAALAAAHAEGHAAGFAAAEAAAAAIAVGNRVDVHVGHSVRDSNDRRDDYDQLEYDHDHRAALASRGPALPLGLRHVDPVQWAGRDGSADAVGMGYLPGRVRIGSDSHRSAIGPVVPRRPAGDRGAAAGDAPLTEDG